jgi:hypothetical protein
MKLQVMPNIQSDRVRQSSVKLQPGGGGASPERSAPPEPAQANSAASVVARAFGRPTKLVRSAHDDTGWEGIERPDSRKACPDAIAAIESDGECLENVAAPFFKI